MSLELDFTTTAMARPGVLNNTLKSFSRNLRGLNLKDCRMIINVDPLPPDKAKRKDVVKVARKYFKEVKHNYPSEANFTAAVNWVWSNAETEYIFHLEDDWELIKPISVPKMLKYFEKNKELIQVILRAYRYAYKTCALSPSIIHRKMYSAIGGNLTSAVNPEAQLRGERHGIIMPTRSRKKGHSHKRLIVVYPEKIKNVVLRDLGRAWINKTSYRKSGGGKKARFTTWEKKPNG